MRALVATLVALVAVSVTAGAEFSTQRILRQKDDVPASIDLLLHRVGVSDTILLTQVINVRYEGAATWKWRSILPAGLIKVSGTVEEDAGKLAVSKACEALIRCERWGSFEILASIVATVDSAHWTADDVRLILRVTKDSFYISRNGHVQFEYVVDGVHYRAEGGWWVPLDPGEEVIEPATHPRVGEAPTLYAERAVRPMSLSDSSSVNVPVLVAVNRAGRVKDAQPYGLQRGISEASKRVAIAAAWKWRFAPAMTKGQPISTIYVIMVPVSAAATD